MTVDAVRDVCTSGFHQSDQGTGYSFETGSPLGDYSAATQGRLQGYRERCRLVILVPGASLSRSAGGDLLLYVPAGAHDKEGYPVSLVEGLFAAEALALGLARVARPQEIP